jgi:hypothetical protein
LLVAQHSLINLQDISMEKLRLNDWLTLSANIAVIAGIVFLGVELRQNNSLLRQEAENVYFDNRVVLSETLMQDGELAAIYVKTFRNEDLDEVEALRVDRYYRRLYRGFEWEYLQSQEGLLNLRRNGEWARMINENRCSRDVWDWFAENASDKSFVEYANNIALNQ